MRHFHLTKTTVAFNSRYCLPQNKSVHYLIISLTEFSFYFATAFLNLNATLPDAHLKHLEVIFICTS